MRQDMYQVLHETARTKTRGYRSRPMRMVDGESLEPIRQSLRRQHVSGWQGRSPRLNLAPLRRFIERNVGRRWDDVYSEMRSALNRQDSVLADPLYYLRLELNTVLVEGEVFARTSWGGLQPLDAVGSTFYVHPVTRLLCRHTARSSGWRKSLVEHRAEREKELAARRKELSDSVQLHCIDGIWYEVELEALPSQAEYAKADSLSFVERMTAAAQLRRRDALLARDVRQSDFRELQELYGRAGCYGKTKRQLSHVELKRHGLVTG